MVCYCCVKGCKNNSNIKKKNPNSTISFHAFPSNPDLKLKWLKAIGRPNWEPPSHTRLCSVHFDYDQISHEGCRTRIQDDACPTKYLPLNSNFEASYLEVCRICLATDLKMYSLQNGTLNSCIDAITGLNENNHIEGMPQFVCYECRACIMKCYCLIEKSIIAQATLLDIFAQNGKLTVNLIKEQNRHQLNLKSSLSCYKTNHIYKYAYDGEVKISSATKIGSIHPDDYFKENDSGLKFENEFISDISEDTVKVDIVDDKAKSEDEGITFSNIKENGDDPIDFNEENNYIVDEKDSMSVYDAILDQDNSNESRMMLKQNRNEQIIDGCIKPERKSMKQTNRKNGLTPSEANMQKHFDIVKLTLQEQIEEWKRATISRPLTSETIFECGICSKIFANIKTYEAHLASHDSSRGKEECPVCKLRFKNEVLVQSHRNRTHGKKFHCKKCPKVFNNVGVAKKHFRWHSGYLYKCGWCPFTSAHESAVGVHARTSHAQAHEPQDAPGPTRTCVHCGVACLNARGLTLHYATAHRKKPEIEISQEYRCDSCDVNFASEGARRVHLLTSNHHKEKPGLCDTSSLEAALKRTCGKCGEEFPSLNELIAHTKSEHRREARKNTSWRLPGDSYPTLCEHCGETVTNRKEHWWHVRKQHPKEKHLYQPVITAICEVCGKGFQNSTKLHLHELRHGRPTVRCDQCPRLFYDKYAAARHSSVHLPARPHSCRTCGRTFRLKGNLHRHSRVHTGVTPYECSMCGKKFKYSTSVNLHVRTVHYKLPHPPRKKRIRARNDSLDINNDNI